MIFRLYCCSGRNRKHSEISTHTETARIAVIPRASSSAQPGRSRLFLNRLRFTGSGNHRLRVETTCASAAASGPSHRSACASGADGLPAHCITLGPARRNRTVRPSILTVKPHIIVLKSTIIPAETTEGLAGCLMPRPVASPRWFAPCAVVAYVLESALPATGYLRRSTDNWRSPTALRV